tara:strand:+ start:7103 stop:8089 length:987 start_codon:yes stop_codon:yes gene_type:complete
MILTTKNIENKISKNSVKTNYFVKGLLKNKCSSKNGLKLKLTYDSSNLKVTTKKCVVHINTNVLDVYAYLYKEPLPAELYHTEINWEFEYPTSNFYCRFSIPYLYNTIRSNTNKILYPNNPPNIVEFLKNHLYDIENENEPLYIHNNSKFRSAILTVGMQENYTINRVSTYLSQANILNYLDGLPLQGTYDHGSSSHSLFKIKNNATYYIRSFQNNTLKIKMKGQPAYANVRINDPIYYDLPTTIEPVMPTSYAMHRHIPYLNSLPMHPNDFLKPYNDIDKVMILRTTTSFINSQGNIVSTGMGYIEGFQENSIGLLQPGHVYIITLN